MGNLQIPEPSLRAVAYRLQDGRNYPFGPGQRPFANEPETLQKMKVFMEEHGLEKNGLHHEVYLSDFRKTPPEKLKTILREPVKRIKKT